MTSSHELKSRAEKSQIIEVLNLEASKHDQK